MDNVKVRYKDKQFEYEKDTTLLDISKDFEKDYDNKIIVGMINNRLASLDSKVSRSSDVDFFDGTSALGRRTYIRGLSFLFAKAVKDVINADVKMVC